MREYKVNAKRVDTHGSVARCKAVEIVLDTDVDGPARRLQPGPNFFSRR